MKKFQLVLSECKTMPGSKVVDSCATIMKK